jgi:hypothetical protein
MDLYRLKFSLGKNCIRSRHLAATSAPRGSHVNATWKPRHRHVAAMSASRGYHVSAAWLPRQRHVAATSVPRF